MSKPFWQSKTLIVNVIALLTYLLPVVKESLPTNWYATILLVMNTAMRFISSTKITWK